MSSHSSQQTDNPEAALNCPTNELFEKVNIEVKTQADLVSVGKYRRSIQVNQLWLAKPVTLTGWPNPRQWFTNERPSTKQKCRRSKRPGFSVSDTRFEKGRNTLTLIFFFLVGCLRSFAPEDVLCVFLSLFFSSSFFFFSSLYIQSSPRFGLLPLSPSFSVTLFFTLSFCLLARMLSRLYVTSSENGVLPFPPPFPSSLAFVLFRSPSTTTHIYSRFPRTSSHSQDA